MARSAPRPGKTHKETTREAGIGPVSFISIVAGTLCAYGAFSLIAALAGALLGSAGVETDFETNDWTGSGAVAALVSALVLLLAYLFGGYVAGRMARRRGLLHGLAVAVLSLVLGAVIGAVVSGLTDDANVKENLRSIGVPTSTDQITGVAIVGVIISLAAIIVGAILGGLMGERWHARLARRAADPSIGPAAEHRAEALHQDEERERRIDQDEAVRADVADRDRDGVPDAEERERTDRTDEDRVVDGDRIDDGDRTDHGHRDDDDGDRNDGWGRDRGDRMVRSDPSDQDRRRVEADAGDEGGAELVTGTGRPGDDQELLTAEQWRQRQAAADGRGA